MDRLVVNINGTCSDFLRDQKEKHGITHTETTRRAFSVLMWLMSEIAKKNRIVVYRPDGSMTEVSFHW